jgi:hypothetical protein
LDKQAQMRLTRKEEESIKQLMERLFSPLRSAWTLGEIEYRFCIKAQDEKGKIFCAEDSAVKM